jgi:RNA polymerase sigma-70 factor, ECF subfamily
MRTASDEALIDWIARGDRQALRTLFDRHHLGLYRFVVRLIGDPSAAEDVTNDVFFEVWRQAERFEGRSRVSTWLLGMARYKALTVMRARREASGGPGPDPDVADLGDSPEVVAQKASKAAALRRCIDALSAQHREIVDLAYYQELSVQEISELVGIPENTVKTRMFHARKHLSALLKAAGIDRGWP